MNFDLKSEEDVKQYIDNLGIEYRFGCYNEKKPESCHLLADYFEGIKKDFERAAKVYKSTCDDYGLTKSCHKYAGYVFLGKGCRQDSEEALRYYTRGCDGGEMQSCLNAGLMHLSGATSNGQQKNLPQAMQMIEKSCSGDNPTGCYYLSGLYITGVKGHHEKDMQVAFKHALKACELGNMYACSNVSQMYRKGDGIDKDEKLAADFRHRAAEMQEQVKKNMNIGFQQGASPS
ncbi:cytochrome c oxidase assembly factor 7 homolog [Pollicipes pollicipes]|uniref:cytochrome c oxidase assembly factor 7 homolog n=1 Tax=Pollicipes pollicipes TaxID=41117 RepID=UPI0018851CD2|nr:cytochrome c oxidase assembly factor 7 homolog [Pollicipes pollicipes]XP_037092237.1 cytochrome c oxidase assembly factor 7 homolog [Pollicipes pollicipes]XP_037092238.1 cytochrome c oxidase assembly factor 7 homolog [Pollicipes pollicipes]